MGRAKPEPQQSDEVKLLLEREGPHVQERLGIGAPSKHPAPFAKTKLAENVGEPSNCVEKPEKSSGVK